MPRRLIIAILIVLILGIIGGTIVLVIQRLQKGTTSTTPQTTTGSLEQAATGDQQIADPTADEDTDGLNNSDEATWGTDPKNPDTDADTYLDGAEVLANHNPTIPGPNDKLPEGFVPGRSVNPLTEAPSEPIAVDQFFANNLDLTGGKRDYTADYRNQYKAEDRTSENLTSYVKAQPIITQLPAPAEKAIQLQKSDTPAALANYLSTAGNLDIFSNRPLFSSVLNDLYTNNDTSTTEGLAVIVRIHQEELLKLQVPPSAEGLQRLLLGYTQLLAATFDQMATYNQDQVKSLVALRQWEEIDKKYVPLIEQETARLQNLVQ